MSSATLMVRCLSSVVAQGNDECTTGMLCKRHRKLFGIRGSDADGTIDVGEAVPSRPADAQLKRMQHAATAASRTLQHAWP